MSVLIVGSTALDSIKTPKAENPRLLGGSASHAAVAASFFGPVQLVGIVGKDFPRRYLDLYRKHKIDLEGLADRPGQHLPLVGRIRSQHEQPAHALATELGVFETFTPLLPASYLKTAFVLLANIAPGLQHHVLDQMRRPKFVVADTMDLWLNIALADLLKLLAPRGRLCLERKRGPAVDAGEQPDSRRQEDPQARPQIRDRQEGRAWRHSFGPGRDVYFARRSRWKKWWTPRARAIRLWAG